MCFFYNYNIFISPFAGLKVSRAPKVLYRPCYQHSDCDNNQFCGINCLTDGCGAGTIIKKAICQPCTWCRAHKDSASDNCRACSTSATTFAALSTKKLRMTKHAFVTTAETASMAIATEKNRHDSNTAVTNGFLAAGKFTDPSTSTATTAMTRSTDTSTRSSSITHMGRIALLSTTDVSSSPKIKPGCLTHKLVSMFCYV